MSSFNFMIQQQEAQRKAAQCEEALFKAGFVPICGVYYTTTKEHDKFQSIVKKYFDDKEANHDNADR